MHGIHIRSEKQVNAIPGIALTALKWAVLLGLCVWHQFGANVQDAIIWLLIFQGLDIFCGVAATTAIEGWAAVKSRKLTVGIMGKVGTWIAVLVLNILAKESGIWLISNQGAAAIVAAHAFTFSEGVSILENLSRMGVPISRSLITDARAFAMDRIDTMFRVMFSRSEDKSQKPPLPPDDYCA